jgi:uncharacterized protein YuzE
MHVLDCDVILAVAAHGKEVGSRGIVVAIGVWNAQLHVCILIKLMPDSQILPLAY